MAKLTSVSLLLRNEDGDRLNIALEPWQVEAVIKILGLSIDYAGNNAYDILMLPQKYVQEMTSKLKYQMK